MKQTVITMNTIRPIHIGEPAGDRRSLPVSSLLRGGEQPHPLTMIKDEEIVSVVGDSMFQKGRCVNTRDLCGQNVAKPRHTGVRAAIVVKKRGNACGAKGGRETNGQTT